MLTKHSKMTRKIRLPEPPTGMLFHLGQKSNQTRFAVKSSPSCVLELSQRRHYRRVNWAPQANDRAFRGTCSQKPEYWWRICECCYHFTWTSHQPMLRRGGKSSRAAFGPWKQSADLERQPSSFIHAYFESHLSQERWKSFSVHGHSAWLAWYVLYYRWIWALLLVDWYLCSGGYSILSNRNDHLETREAKSASDFSDG